MIIVAAGSPYMDIDAYAGCIAYAELLNLQGRQAIAASTAPLNGSITDTIRSWQAPLERAPQVVSEDTFVVIDISEAAFFDTFVDAEKVEEVLDHHPGFEEYWQQKIGDKATIEFIGAACTLVFEKWQQAGQLDQMSVVSAKLLSAGILDNTLNFKASVTTDRDRRAYVALMKIAGLDDNWPAEYFGECQQYIIDHMAEAVDNDTKPLRFSTAPVEVIPTGQLAVWDPQSLVYDQRALLGQVMASKGTPWLVNILSIDEGCSYFVCEDMVVQTWLEGLLDIKFDGTTARADRLWLRKEIIKQDLSIANT